ncbi:MAG: hypothetical protein RL026_1298 [Pseudomonadota bacterium]
MGNGILERKADHLEVVLGQDVGGHVGTGLDRVRFEHCALPEIDWNDIDLSTDFLGRRLRAPLLVSAMTGGPDRARHINESIACAAAELGIAFGVGSQRVALEGAGGAGLSRRLRSLAPEVPLLANLGAAQLLEPQGAAMARRAVEMIEADALVIHLNPLQEVLQRGGDRRWAGIAARIGALTASLPVPVIVKEIGCGLSASVARRLVAEGVQGLDVAGAGGTSWAAVEASRHPPGRERDIAECFRNWGIPTAEALVAVRAECPGHRVIASGGLRSGRDVAAALRLGADLAGFAAAVLPDALHGSQALVQRLSQVIEELRIVAFCTGSVNLAALRQVPLL